MFAIQGAKPLGRLAVATHCRSLHPSRQICRSASPAADVVLGLQTLPDTVNVKKLQRQEYGVLAALRLTNKRVKDLTKRMKKVPASEQSALLMEMEVAFLDMESQRTQLQSIVVEMVAAGYEGCESSSSDEDDKKPKKPKKAKKSKATLPPLDSSMCLQGLEVGTITMCTGKACSGKGGSIGLRDTLTHHFAESDSIKVEESGCMGHCKKCANMLVYNKTNGDLQMVNHVTPELLTIILDAVKVPSLV